MANTVTVLSYANTFGDWVITTNALTKENNDLAANNYVKPTGTLYLNSPTLGLQVANNAIVGGQLQVQGVGSSAYVQNGLRVDGLLNITTNATIGGQLLVNGSFVLNGDTVYSTNTFTINANNAVGINSTFNVNRGVSGANASIRWNETNKYFDILNVTSSSYFKILTEDLLSSSGTLTSASNVATSLALSTANTFLQANDALTLSAARSYTNANVAALQISINAANTNAANASYLTVGTIPSARLPVTGVTASVYGGSTQIPVLTVDATGRITSASNTSVSTTITLNGSSGTGSVSGGGSLNVTTSNASVITVPVTGSTYTVTPQVSGAVAGVYGGANTMAVIAVDQFGRATSVSNVAPSGTFNISVLGTANNITAYSINQNLSTTANTQFFSLGVGTAGSGTSGEIRATNNITAYYSDERLKTNLGNIPNALEKVMSLNGFYYEANQVAQDLGYSVRREVGLSAQQVQAVLPEIVVPAPIDDKYLTIHYERVVPLLVEAIKELQAEIEILKKK